jgi:hypothetical protein
MLERGAQHALVVADPRREDRRPKSLVTTWHRIGAGVKNTIAGVNKPPKPDIRTA